MQTRISFRSRSDLVLDADHVLEFLSNLVLQTVSRFERFSHKWRISVLPCSHKNAVAPPPPPKIPETIAKIII